LEWPPRARYKRNCVFPPRTLIPEFSSMPRILVTPTVFKNVRGPFRDVLEKADFEMIFPESDAVRMDRATLVKHLAGIDGVLASVEQYDAEVLAATKLRAIARVGVGYDSIDLSAATKYKVAVAITP